MPEVLTLPLEDVVLHMKDMNINDVGTYEARRYAMFRNVMMRNTDVVFS